MDLAKAYDFAEPMAGIIMLRWHKRHTSHGCERCAMIRPQWKEVASALGDQLDAECCGKEDIRLFWLRLRLVLQVALRISAHSLQCTFALSSVSTVWSPMVNGGQTESVASKP